MHIPDCKGTDPNARRCMHDIYLEGEDLNVGKMHYMILYILRGQSSQGK